MCSATARVEFGVASLCFAMGSWCGKCLQRTTVMEDEKGGGHGQGHFCSTSHFQATSFSQHQQFPQARDFEAAVVSL